MYHHVIRISLSILLCLIWFTSAAAQDEPVTTTPVNQVTTIKPNFMPPSEILDFLGVRILGGRGILDWKTSSGMHVVEIRHNAAANLLIISGEATDVEFVKLLIQKADVAPRQIEIKVKIIEVGVSKSRDLGIDWDRLLTTSNPYLRWSYSRDTYDRDTKTSREEFSESERYYTDTTSLSSNISNQFSQSHASESKKYSHDFDLSANFRLSNVIKLLDESGAGTVRTAPRILTLNNRRATILDGQRVTYVTRYSSYTNLFETDSMDAGLTLSVLPSLGESGYITLNINAELTTLKNTMSGSPIKDGQMIENTIIVKDGESVLLGGLSRTQDSTIRKRFPILGHVLPFLFSREVAIKEQVESFIILTPHVVDFATALDEQTINTIQGE